MLIIIASVPVVSLQTEQKVAGANTLRSSIHSILVPGAFICIISGASSTQQHPLTSFFSFFFLASHRVQPFRSVIITYAQTAKYSLWAIFNQRRPREFDSGSAHVSPSELRCLFHFFFFFGFNIFPVFFVVCDLPSFLLSFSFVLFSCCSVFFL